MAVCPHGSSLSRPIFPGSRSSGSPQSWSAGHMAMCTVLSPTRLAHTRTQRASCTEPHSRCKLCFPEEPWRPLFSMPVPLTGPPVESWPRRRPAFNYASFCEYIVFDPGVGPWLVLVRLPTFFRISEESGMTDAYLGLITVLTHIVICSPVTVAG